MKIYIENPNKQSKEMLIQNYLVLKTSKTVEDTSEATIKKVLKCSAVQKCGNAYVHILIPTNVEFSPCAIVEMDKQKNKIVQFYPHDCELSNRMHIFSLGSEKFAFLLGCDVYHFELAKLYDTFNIDFLILLPIESSSVLSSIVKVYQSVLNATIICATGGACLPKRICLADKNVDNLYHLRLKKTKPYQFCHPKVFKIIYQRLNLRKMP